jgi:hypothetical protein
VSAIHDANNARLPPSDDDDDDDDDDDIRSLAASEEDDDDDHDEEYDELADDDISPIILGANIAARPAVIPRLTQKRTANATSLHRRGCISPALSYSPGIVVVVIVVVVVATPPPPTPECS